MLASAPLPLLVRGKVVQPDGGAKDRWLLLREGRVESVSRQRPPMTEHLVVLDTGSEDWIFPGLIDLDPALGHHLLPPFEPTPGKSAYGRRSEWLADETYGRQARDLAAACDAWQRALGRRALAVFAELRAIAGGTAVLPGPASSEAGEQSSIVLGRDATSAVEMGLEGTALPAFDVFESKDGAGEPVPRKEAIDRYVQLRDGGALRAAFARAADGRAGFAHADGVDLSTRREFEALMAHPAFADADAVRRSRLSILGGGGVDTRNRRHLDFLRERGIAVVWSPTSDLSLYGDTLDVESLLRSGVTVALRSAGASGSKHVWAEAKLARKWLHAIDALVADEQIVRMATVDAASCLGVDHASSLAPGDLADLFIVRSPLATDNPFEAFFAAADRDVRATIV
ncbi:MAG: amidohydrolase family protein, partial [Acidobacteriota bacterium]